MPVSVRFAEGPIDLAWCVAHDGWLDEPELRRKMRAREVVVAELNGEVVGLARLDYLWSSLPHLAQVRVVEHHRREGVGRALVAFVEHQARSRGMDKILSSTRPDKTEAQEWHRHVGFTECGSLDGFGPNGEPTMFFLKTL
jgi:N-acetylglutamate synthase-like GNAT family acetyltransferase